MKTRLGLFALALALLGLTSCATPSGQSFNESDVYRAQDQVFRPMGQ